MQFHRLRLWSNIKPPSVYHNVFFLWRRHDSILTVEVLVDGVVENGIRPIFVLIQYGIVTVHLEIKRIPYNPMTAGPDYIRFFKVFLLTH